MKLRFQKMQGLGNDFVVIDAINQSVDLERLSIPQLADRHTGIGFDQLLIIQPSSNANFFCRIFNADGSEAEQCGNGLRCVARLIHEEGLFNNTNLQLETIAGIFPVSIENYDNIRVTMNAPHIQEKMLELNLQSAPHAIPISVLSLGNPHAIVKVESVDGIQADKLGPEISSHTFFPNGTNVGFMQILNAHHIRLRTFERGTGETHACGSNACAAACTGIVNGWLQHQVNVEFRYGRLLIEWEGGDKPVHMSGPAAKVFSGELELI